MTCFNFGLFLCFLATKTIFLALGILKKKETGKETTLKLANIGRVSWKKGSLRHRKLCRRVEAAEIFTAF